MTNKDVTPDHHLQQRAMAVCFWIMQVTGFIAVLLCIAFFYPAAIHPWGRTLALGILLALCSLTSAGTVLGMWPVFVRLVCGAAIVSCIIFTLEAAEKYALSQRLPFEEAAFTGLFALGLWLIIQCPFWVARLSLAARAVTYPLTSGESSIRSQYGIRQLMALTFVVALTLGALRMFIPEKTLQDVREIAAATWLFLVAMAGALGLVAVTTVITTLHVRYWRAGIAVTAVSSVLVTSAVYSISLSLKPGSIQGEEHLFAVMILCTYAWLQISLLLARAAGYRIVVRTSLPRSQ